MTLVNEFLFFCHFDPFAPDSSLLYIQVHGVYMSITIMYYKYFIMKSAPIIFIF